MMFVTIATLIYRRGKNKINGMFPLYYQAEQLIGHPLATAKAVQINLLGMNPA